jgi:hypothetical protein
MSNAGYYRSEAERWRKSAEASKDPEVARRRRALANDYNALADEVERVPHSLHLKRIEMQQRQPVRQQPRKTSQGEE